MGVIATTANTVFRDYVVDGVPSSGANPPSKSNIRSLFGTIDSQIARQVATSPVTIQVGFAGAIDSPTSTNCATLQQAYSNLCNNYDHNGFVPVIQCAGPTTSATAVSPTSSGGGGGSVQTYSGGLDASFITSDTPGQTPNLVGASQIMLDGGGSIITSSVGHTIQIREVPLLLSISNMQIGNTTSVGAFLLYAYFGGAGIELAGGITFLGTASTYPAVCASRYGRIHTRPGTRNYNISGGALAMFNAIIGGRIELEGIVLNTAANGLAFSNGYFYLDETSNISINNIAFTGYNIVGPPYQVQELSFFKTYAVAGGALVPIPADPGNPTGSPAFYQTTNTFSAVPGVTYLPGSVPPTLFNGGKVDYAPVLVAPTSYTVDPLGTPSTLTVTGTIIQGAEPAFNIVLGSTSAITAGKLVKCTVNLGTTTSWRNASVSTSNPGALSILFCVWTGSTGTTPGHVDIYWTATAYAPASSEISVQLMEGN